jgi:hypothetical protein
MALSNLTLKSASVFLMLIYTIPVIGQHQYDILLKKRSILKNDEFEDCNAKILISDNKLILFSEQKSPKKSSNQLYEVNYPAYDLKTGRKTQIKVRINEPLFEYIDIKNLETHTCDNFILLCINEYAIQNLDYAKTKLLILKKTDETTYTEINHIDNFQLYEGDIYQISPSRILFYKNNDYHPLDDSIPTITSIYNVESGTFEKIQVEKFEGLYVTNLVGQLVAAKNKTIYRAYPTKNMVTVSDELLNIIDTLFVPISKKYSQLYNNIDSLKQVYTSKKEFIYASKKIDKHIERIESIYLLSTNELGIIIKPENIDNFETRKLLVYDITNKKFTNTIKLDYDYSGEKRFISEPNFTYNGNAVLFCEGVNAIVYTTTDNYIKNSKIKGSKNYFIHVMKYIQGTTLTEHNKVKSNLQFTSYNDINLTLFSLKGDTINLSQLLAKKSVILVKNKKNCSPCFKKAHQFINKEFSNYDIFYVCEYSGLPLNHLVDEKNIKKALKVKNIYYFKPEHEQSKDLPNLKNTPTPFIISSDDNKINYVPLNLIIED